MVITWKKLRLNNLAWAKITRSIINYGKQYKRLLWLGLLMSILIVLVRVVLPFCFKWVIDNWLIDSKAVTPAWIDTLGPGLSIGLFFLILVTILGYADYAARLYFARYSIGAIRNLRSEAFSVFKHTRDTYDEANHGDLISRLVSDAARMKAGLKGFLIHVATNSLLLLTVSIVLLFTDVCLGAIFVGGFVLVVGVTYFVAGSIYLLALKYRDKEGKLAEMISNTLETPTSHHYANSINDSSGRHEASLTRLQGYCTWFAHSIFGLIILLTLIIGLNRVETGLMANSDLILFLLYGLTIRAPLIQLTRQGSRTGKIFACGYRLLQILETGSSVKKRSPNADWKNIKLKKIKIYASGIRGEKRRLGSISLTIMRGQRILIQGRKRAGKTTLLEVIANNLSLDKGKRFWDGTNYKKLDKQDLSQHILFVEENPYWPRIPLSRLIGLDEGIASQQDDQLLESLGMKTLISGLTKGVDSKLTSSDLTPRERRLFGIAIAALGNYSLILLDSTFLSMSKKQSEAALKILFEAKPWATIIVTSQNTFAPELFDQVIHLEKGRVTEDVIPDNKSLQEQLTMESLQT